MRWIYRLKLILWPKMWGEVEKNVFFFENRQIYILQVIGLSDAKSLFLANMGHRNAHRTEFCENAFYWYNFYVLVEKLKNRVFQIAGFFSYFHKLSSMLEIRNQPHICPISRHVGQHFLVRSFSIDERAGSLW